MVYFFAGAFSGVFKWGKERLFTNFAWKKPVFCGIIFLKLKSRYFTGKYRFL